LDSSSFKSSNSSVSVSDNELPPIPENQSSKDEVSPEENIKLTQVMVASPLKSSMQFFDLVNLNKHIDSLKNRLDDMGKKELEIIMKLMRGG
jgi:hypothetical protein